MDELIGWLREQLDEDERVARAAAPERPWQTFPWRYEPGNEERHGGKIKDAEGYTVVHQEDGTPEAGEAEHIARWDPARVLAEVEAKRKIMDLADEASGLDMSVDLDRRVGIRDEAVEPYLGDQLLRLLAQPYAGRPGWRDEWRAV